jgi:long-chain acyl-CoA synthetase
VPRLLTALDRTVRRRGDAPALFTADSTLTWRELAQRAGGVARRLVEQGLEPGDRVAVLLPNGWRFAVALLGGLMAGATVSPLNPALSAAERDRTLADLRPRIVLDAVGDETADWSLTLEPRAAALILYTSGSTGRPKGAVLSHAALDAALVSWAGPVMGLTATDCVLATLPLSHSFGINGALLAPILAGARVVIVEPFTPPGVLAGIAQHGVTVFPGVATMFRRLLDTPSLDPSAFKTLRIAISGAAPCSWDLAQEWRERTGVRILRGYGMTELFRPISFRVDDARDLPESIGRPVPGVEARTMDDAGRPQTAGETGELWIRSPAVMENYLEAPEETQAVLTDGWFRTGDLATISSDGFVTIAGRKKELILRGGYSVVPGEVEAALLAHPAVAEAAVIGVPHPDLGEEVAAFVTLRPGVSVDPAALTAHCRDQLAGYKYPRHVTVLDALPKSSTGKVLKAQLSAGYGATDTPRIPCR